MCAIARHSSVITSIILQQHPASEDTGESCEQRDASREKRDVSREKRRQCGLEVRALDL